MRWLLLATLLLTGCLLPPAGYDSMGYDAHGAYEERLPSSVVIQKAGMCQLRCTRIGNTPDCKEDRC